MQSWREFSLAIADQFLISEDSGEWIKVPQVRRAWYLVIVSTLVFIAYNYVGSLVIFEWAASSVSLTLMWRLTVLSGFCWLLILEGILASAYYRYLLSTGRDLRFRNIVTFWAAWVLLFAYLYESVYFLNPTLFSYPMATVIPGKTMQHFGILGTMKTFSHFLLYSAANTVSLTVPGLTSASFVVSTLNLAEAIGSLMLLVLLVATFVNKSNLRKQKS